jgi:hypothetical protein
MHVSILEGSMNQRLRILGLGWCGMPAIPAIWEVEIRKTVVQGQPGKKKQQEPISTNKLYMVVLICNPNHMGGKGRRMVV